MIIKEDFRGEYNKFFKLVDEIFKFVSQKSSILRDILNDTDKIVKSEDKFNNTMSILNEIDFEIQKYKTIIAEITTRLSIYFIPSFSTKTDPLMKRILMVRRNIYISLNSLKTLVVRVKQNLMIHRETYKEKLKNERNRT